MRSAERADMWGAIEKKPNRETQLLSFSFSGISGLQNGLVTFSSPITAICGVNGTGKSSILRALWATLDWSSAEAIPEIRERLKALQSEAILRISGVETVYGFPRTPDAPEMPAIIVLHVDPSATAVQLQRRACEINALEELLEAITPSTLEPKEISNLSAILRKQYERIEIYEIEDYSEEDPMPFVSVSEHGRAYDIRTMSLGEISVFVMYWQLLRAGRNSIVLLEEPETFLSPVSQGALLDYLAAVCVRKQLSVVLTTHSPQMFARLQPNQVKFVYRSAAGALIAGEQAYGEMRKAVGIEPVVDRVLFVEDRAAREFTLSILKKLDRSILLRAEVVDVGGHAQITRVLSTIPQQIRFFRAIGVYDGDVRGQIVDERPHAFLPAGTLEITFRGLINSKPDDFAQRLGRNPEQIAVTLADINGIDHHDWFEELGKRLNITYAEIMHVCFEEWCAAPENQSEVEKFLAELTALMN
jgi:predicted ATPase